MRIDKYNKGFSNLELLLSSLIITGLLSISLVKSADLLGVAKLYAKSKQSQILISNAISSAYRQNSKLTLIITKKSLQLFKAGEILEQLTTNNNIHYSHIDKQIDSSWAEYIYPSGSQSPFSLIISNQSGKCIISVSLRGRVSCKCL